MLERLHTEYWKKGVEIVAVNVMPQVPLEGWQKYLKKIGLKNAIIAVDTKYAAVDATKVRTPGATVIINKEGVEIYRDGSASSYEDLKLALAMGL